MSEWFALSYGFLCVVFLLETAVLREAVRKAAWFQRFYADFDRGEEWHGLEPGTRAPRFSLPTLAFGKRLRTSALEGRSSILFFVSAQASSADTYGTLAPALHAWWHRLEGHVYLICTGAREACRRFVETHANGFPAERTVYDEAGVLTRGFRISNMPQAVELDEDVQVKQCGRPGVPGFDTEIDGTPGAADAATGGRQFAWPDERPMSGAAFARVDTTISCVLTRFHLNSPLSLVPFYLAFRRVRRASRDISGLMEAVFLVEGFRTCYTLSFWKNDWSIVEFGRVRAHIEAANSAFRHTYTKDRKRAEIWSAQFRLWAVSCHNMSWDGLDFQTALGDQWRRREAIAHVQGVGDEHNAE